MEINFFVPGDPVGKVKLTRGQQWTPQAQNYSGYKDAVQRAIQPALVALSVDLRETDQKKLAKGSRYTKPISVKEKIQVDVVVHFRDEAHPDPSNVLETILDAIFVNDKHVKGSFDYDHINDMSCIPSDKACMKGSPHWCGLETKVGVDVKITIPA